MSSAQWIGIGIAALLAVASMWVAGLFTRAANPDQENAINRVLRPLRFILAVAIMTVAVGVGMVVFFQRPSSTSETPSIEACPDGKKVGASTPIKARNGTVIAFMAVMHSDICRVSWNQVTPAPGTRGAQLEVTVELSAGDSHQSRTDSITTTPLATAAVPDNGKCVTARAVISSAAGTVSTVSRCVRVGN